MLPDNAPSQTPAAAPATYVAPPSPAEADFEAIHAAVMATERGRWFLHEYAGRKRHADTAEVLAAIDRLMVIAQANAGLKALAPPDPPPHAKPSETGADIGRLRAELADMANAIARTKAEIASIKPDAANADDHHDRILAATEQLDSVVRTTEHATSDILAAAEQVQEVAWTMREQGMEPHFCDQLDGYATAIYTACSFQDLTGQRTRKIIHVLRYLEARIHAITGLWGDAPAASQASPAHDDPAGPGDLVQNDVDRMMAPPAPVPVERLALPEPAAPIQATAAEPVAVGFAFEGPKGSFSLVPEVAARSRHPIDIPVPTAAPLPAEREQEPHKEFQHELQATLQVEFQEELEEKLQEELQAGPLLETETEFQPEAEPEPQQDILAGPDAAIADLRAFASDLVAELRNAAASTAVADVEEPPALLTDVASAAAPAIETPALVAEPRAEAALQLAAAPQLVELNPHPTQHPPKHEPGPAVAAVRRASDIAENLFADVMALTAEERIALFT